MTTLPEASLKLDRRDLGRRLAEPQPCPACDTAPAQVSPMARTEHLVFFGCNACWHVWSVAKPGHEDIDRPSSTLTRSD